MRTTCGVAFAFAAWAGVAIPMTVEATSAAPDEVPQAPAADASVNVIETWGFEPGEGFVPGPAPGQMGWWGLNVTDEPHIDTANPHSGAQHVRFSRDPDLPPDDWTDLISPEYLDTFPDNSVMSIRLAIGATGGASYVVGLHSVTQQSGTARVWFESDGDILVLDRLPGVGYTWVDTGSDWTPGGYEQLEIRVDPIDDMVEYTYGSSSIYTTGVYSGSVIEQVWLSSDNSQNGDHGDFDDLVVDHGRVGPVLHRWTFSMDGSDSVGGADATLHNGAAVEGGALVLDGVDDHAWLPISSTLRVLTDVSVEMWVAWTGSSPWQRFFDFGDNTTVNWFMTPMASQTGRPRVAITASGIAGEQRTDAPDAFPTGTRTHVVYTLDGDGPADQSKLYIDGVLVAVHHEDAPLDPAELDWVGNTWLGRSQYAADPYLEASIYDLAIYSTVLTEAEVLERYRVFVFADGFESGGLAAWSASVP